MSVNSGFNGNTDINILAEATGSQIPALATYEVNLGIRWKPDLCSTGIFYNSATLGYDNQNDGTVELEFTDNSVNGFNTDPDNNGDPTDDESVTNITLTTISEADLVINKTVDDNNPDEGDILNYVITAENKGPCDVTNMSLMDNLPAGVTVQNAVPSSGTVTP